ncbi:barstar family protein [Parabacteroides sp. Marseille-P3160]|uniref:barstar family protein n=1 Tax=Parabacteroides sp. Marseille-P3160 TaxID=1917887 RepID=UPI0009BC24DB|nr:barstar family protein [Parabacteroides sp. Marseille-P3160]
MKKGRFYFIDNFDKKKNDHFFLVIIEDENFSEEEILNEYYRKLKLPDYFGFNWDALQDCLRDLDWIEQRDVVIYHQQLPRLNEKDLKIYLRILDDIVGHWDKFEEHNFYVYFNISDYDTICKYIGNF